MRSLLAVCVSALAFACVSTGIAQAGTGRIHDDYFGSCDVTFTTGAVAPGGGGFIGQRTLSNLADDTSSGKSCVHGYLEGGLTVEWRADGSGQASMSFDIDTGIFGECSYSGTIAGVATPTGFTLFPSPGNVSKTGGFFICPSTLNLVNYFGDMTHFTY